MGSALRLAAIAAGLAAAGFAWALLHPGPAARACGAAGPFDFDTLELENHVADYAKAIHLAVEGKAVTFAYAMASGEAVDLRYQGLKSGSRNARLPESQALRIPPSVYYSIAWIEANWSNGAANVPFGGVGPVLRSFDCGYGLGQVTTGMSNETGTPTMKQALVGTHFLFNIAEGVRILADKWNSAPKFRPIAGNGDPAALEDWYYAIWSYNGFAFSNHPLNPNRDPLRGGGLAPVYHCFDENAPSYQPDATGYPKFGYGDYTYPERVYGCMRFPPLDKSASPLPPEPVPAPTPGAPKFVPGDVVVVAGAGCLNVRPTPSLASAEPIGCFADGVEMTVLAGPTAAEGITWWQVRTAKGDGWAAETYLVKKAARPRGPRMWAPQDFLMPDFTIPAVGAAFRPGNFITCEANGFSGGCPAMDYPTTIAEFGITPHSDSTPPADPAGTARFLGDPRLAVTGPKEIDFAAPGAAAQAVITVRNAGTWIAPFRVRSSAPWVTVQHQAELGSARTLDGGVAVGRETEVVVQAAKEGSTRIARAGHDNTLVVTVNPGLLPPGTSQARLWIEPLLGGGGVFEMTIRAANGTGGYPNRAVAPGLSADR